DAALDCFVAGGSVSWAWRSEEKPPWPTVVGGGRLAAKEGKTLAGREPRSEEMGNGSPILRSGKMRPLWRGAAAAVVEDRGKGGGCPEKWRWLGVAGLVVGERSEMERGTVSAVKGGKNGGWPREQEEEGRSLGAGRKRR
ncbi:hypothetical protein H0E87_001848, partial [Populus deltoides]